MLLGSILLPLGRGFSIYKIVQRTWLRILPIALEEEVKVFDFIEWLNYYYFILLDYIPLFLHFLTSLLKATIWKSGKG